MNFKGLHRTSYAKNWDEALPIGNGTMGALIMGDPISEVYITNHEELYLPLPENNESRPFNGFPRLEETRKMIREGKYEAATRYYIDGLEEDGCPKDFMIWPNPFETASELHIDMEAGKAEDYDQILDFTTGEAIVTYKVGKTEFCRRSFISRSRNLLAIEISTNNKEKFSFDISLQENENAAHIEEPNHFCEGDCLFSVVTHSEDESGYLSMAQIICDASQKSAYTSGNGFYISKTNKVVILYTLAPWKGKKAEATRLAVLRNLENAPDSYDELLKEHVIIHREMFNRVTVNFSDSNVAYTNDELREMSKDSLAPEFFERMVDMGRYLEISSFGTLPPNLQGVWNGTPTPPWSSDYTLDENIQMMMWQVLPGDFPEFARNYFDWLESYVEDFRKNAMAYYGCRGIFSAPRVSSDGNLRHFGMPWPMCFWTAGAGWLSQVYEDYYEYTLDKNILQRGVKFWKDVVLFYEDFMQVGADGKYEFIPSYSPENTPLGNDSPTAINSTMDVAIAREVYTNLINACKILDIEEENIEKWQEELSNLPDYAVNEDGALKEWIPEIFKDDYHHRHSSHLYMVFPGHEALSDGNDALLEACHSATKYRLLDGVDAISGWGLAHLANISARLKDDNLWYLALNRLITKFTLDNLFTGHNEHSLFQMDANLGITAAAYEMFAYSDMDKIELLPVLCDKLPYVCIKGLQARNNVCIKFLEKEGEWIRATLVNLGNKDVRIVCPKGYSLENGDREITLRKGQTLDINGYKRE